MLRAAIRTVLLFGWLNGLSPPGPDSFAIDMAVEVAGARKHAEAEQVALGALPKPRVVLEARTGEPITARWTLRSTDSSATMRDVLVHFFVVQEESAGQRAVPDLDKNVAVESALTMDFKPRDKTQGDLSFVVDKPGAYLLRLETIGAVAGSDGRDCFAALDLVIR